MEINVKKLMKEYQGIQVDTTVEQAGPHKLVSLLMNGALEKLIRAKASNDAVLRRELVGKSISIIDYLRASLNPGADLEFSNQLGDLYSYMETQLLDSTLHCDEAPIENVIALLKPVRDGWDGIDAEYRS